MKKFELKDLAEFIGEPIIENVKVESVYVDSRLCTPNSVFFALKGETHDGHMFLDKAAKNGSIAAIVSKEYSGEDYGMQLLKTENPLELLQSFAKKLVKSRAPLIIGITGSVGKTTTKEFLATILEKDFALSKNRNSYNGQIGLPLSILNSDPVSDILVLEYGMNMKSEMANLLKIAEPHIAIITPIASAHLGNFASIEEIAKEKSVILESKHLRLAIIHEISNVTAPIKSIKGIKKVTYGVKDADYKISKK